MGMTLIGFWYPLSRMTWATVSDTTTAKSEWRYTCRSANRKGRG